MRTQAELRHIQKALYHMRVAQGRYLTDVAYEELCPQEIANLIAEATHLHFKTGIVLRRVIIQGKRKWRFMNKNGL